MTAPVARERIEEPEPWLTPGVKGIGSASLLADLGHEIPAALLILRATELFESGRSTAAAAQLALVLYTAYNVAATFVSIPAGRAGDAAAWMAVAVAGLLLTNRGAAP